MSQLPSCASLKCELCAKLKGVLILTNLCFDCDPVKVIKWVKIKKMQRLHQDVLKYMGEVSQMGGFSFYSSHSSVLLTACVNSWETWSPGTGLVQFPSFRRGGTKPSSKKAVGVACVFFSF